jgi:hypothetical protein
MTFKLPVLVSYAYANQQIFEMLHAHRDRIELLVDCGAFTAWTSGKEVKLDDYCEFIKSLPLKPLGYFALDVIGNPELTRKNFDAMRKRKLAPIPIITRDETVDGMRYYMKHSHLLALGGVTGKDNASAAAVEIALRTCPRERVHILGLTSTKLLKLFRPFSADSSSWTSGARYGDLRFPWHNGDMKSLKRAAFTKRPPEWAVRIIRDLGFDPKLLAVNQEWSGQSGAVRRIGAALAALRSKQMQERLGTKLFLAFSQRLQLEQLIDGHRRLK